MLLLSVITACAQKLTFPTLSDNPNITSVYVTKGMLSLLPSSNSIPDGIPSELVKKLDSIEIIEPEGKKGVEEVRKTIENYVNSTPELEILMHVNDDGDKMTFYGLPAAATDTYSKLILYITDSEDATLIIMTGNINTADISGIKL